jgi:8-hydroxy-5-deazaflavin:NADPH oxidoreductase
MNWTVGVVGSGNIGATVVRRSAAAGYPVIVGNQRGPDSLMELAAEFPGVVTPGTVAEAVAGADLVVLAMPIGAYRSVPVEALAGKPVVDAMNYLPQMFGTIEELESTRMPTSAFVQTVWPDAHVVKALNTIDFLRLPLLARSANASDRTAVPIAGNDPAAKEMVAALVNGIGFDSLDIGPLSESWRVQPGTPAYVTPYSAPDPAVTDPYEAFRSASPVPVSTEQLLGLVAAAGQRA